MEGFKVTRKKERSEHGGGEKTSGLEGGKGHSNPVGPAWSEKDM